MIAQSIVGDRREGRPEDDFYPTPPNAVYALLGAERFCGVVWEPACGDGAISKILNLVGEYGLFLFGCLFLGVQEHR